MRIRGYAFVSSIFCAIRGHFNTCAVLDSRTARRFDKSHGEISARTQEIRAGTIMADINKFHGAFLFFSANLGSCLSRTRRRKSSEDKMVSAHPGISSEKGVSLT